MIEVLSVENMRRSDAHTIGTGTAGRELMMRAGRAIFENADWKPPVAIVCGTGNNAGDGYVLAKLLKDSGIDVTLVLLEEKFSEDGRYYFDICRESGIEIILWKTQLCELTNYSTIVDCIFGTGFRGEVRGKAAEVIAAINSSGAYVISVDINSGLNGDSGMAGAAANPVRSDLTISIGSFKPGHFLNMAKDVMKNKINCDIGITPVEKPYYLLEKSDIKPFFMPRPNYSNKGTYGYIALIGGSKRYSGAIRLAAMANAAMRSGAGVVKVAVPDSLSPVVAPAILESTLFPLSDVNGEVRFVRSEIDELISNVKTIAFGMGIGVTEESTKILEYLLENYNGRLIVDADGLTVLAGFETDKILNSKPDLVLTPHIKEFSRLLQGWKRSDDFSINRILESPIDYAQEYARSHNVVLLLKGPSTIITDGNISYITDAGCAGMATAGSGDVLSGILAAVCAYLPDMPDTVYLLGTGDELSSEDILNDQLILADKPDTSDMANNTFISNNSEMLEDAHSDDRLAISVAVGAYINGKAGELAQEKINSISMVASDTVSCIAEVISGL